MSRDRTTDEIIEDILFKPRRELEDLEMRLRILVNTAKKEAKREKS